MKPTYLVILIMVCLSGCSSKSGGIPEILGNVFGGGSSSGLNEGQLKAKEVLSQDIKHLNNPQYGITEDELALLKSENLLTPEELNSLKIVR